jgi:hypothetical protein
VRATEAECVVWTFVSNLLREPETIRVGMERLIEEERTSQAQDPEHEAELWAQGIADWTGGAALTRTSRPLG